MLISRPVVTVAGAKADILEGQSAVNRSHGLMRRMRHGFESCPSKKFIGWADGVKITSRRYYGWRQSRYFKGRMAEWLRPQTSIAENGLNIRRISVGSILSLKEVHRLGGWC